LGSRPKSFSCWIRSSLRNINPGSFSCFCMNVTHRLTIAKEPETFCPLSMMV
jgi:hypothetical protein